MSRESLQMFMVGAVAILLVFQATALVGIVLLLLKVRKPIEQLVANACEIVEIARRRADHLDVALEQISQVVQNRVEQADGMARDLLGRSRTLALAADQFICDLALKIQHTTWEMERIVRKPFREAHAVGAGFRIALESLGFHRRSRTNGRDA